MFRIWRYVAFALVLAPLYSTVAEAREPAGEMILVRFRHSSGFCAGLCPDFELQVGLDREVTSHSLHRHDSHRFRASPSQLRSFRRILAPLRPTGERQLDTSCARDRTADCGPDPLDDPRPNDIEIFWSGGRTEARLTACGYTHLDLRRTVESALRALGADPFSGRQVRPED
jgi:hypothetical protein